MAASGQSANPAFSREPNHDTIGRIPTAQVFKAEFIAIASARHEEVLMGDRFSTSMVTVAIAAAAVSIAVSVLATGTSAQAPAASNPALKTPWGEPDLQGIWTEEFDTPLQRPARYASQEF